MKSLGDFLDGLALRPSVAVDAGQFLIAISVSLLVSLVVIGLYKAFYSRPESGSDMQRAFLLLGPSVTALFLAIQFSIPLSLGLFGVFAIVRFRNPVRDPEELGYLMFLLASAVMTATLQFHLVLLLLLVGTLALAARHLWSKVPWRRKPSGLHVISLEATGAEDVEAEVLKILRREVPNAQIGNISYTLDSLTVHCGFKGQPVSAARLGSALEKVSSVRQIDTFFGGGS